LLNSFSLFLNDYVLFPVEDVNEEISSTTANLQQLNLQKGELGAPSADDNPAVIIPRHLQVTNADYSHLSFGSFGSSVNATTGLFSPKPPGPNLEMAAVPEDTPLDQLNSRYFALVISWVLLIRSSMILIYI